MNVQSEINRDQEIPKIGLGLWKITDESMFNDAFEAAVGAGYRHFDTAQVYNNEQLLGAAWQASGVPREELFVTTKVAVQNLGARKTPRSIAVSLDKLQTDYVDLLLLHFPVPVLRKKAWLALERAKASGQARMIGVSNYTIRHLEDMKTYASELPAVNQVELHVFLQQPELLAYCQAHDIAVEAYSPLAHARDMDNETIQTIADKHSVTYAQVMLRWCVEKGLIILPKSTTPARIAQNIEVLNFTLDDQDMLGLSSLDRDLRTCWSPALVP